MSAKIRFGEADYGFFYGAAEVTRLFSDPKTGRVVIGIKTPKQAIQIGISRTGKVRIHNNDGEWTAPPKKVVK